MVSPWVAGVKIARRKLKMIRDKSRGVEKLLKDIFSMGSGGQGRRKEKQRYEDDYVRRKIQQPFPSNGVRKLVGYFSVTNKSASARILL